MEKTSNLEKLKKCDLLVVLVDRQELYEEIIKQQQGLNSNLSRVEAVSSPIQMC